MIGLTVIVSIKRSPEVSVLPDFFKVRPLPHNLKLRDGLYRHRKRRQGEGRTGSIQSPPWSCNFTSGCADAGPSDQRNCVGSLYLRTRDSDACPSTGEYETALINRVVPKRVSSRLQPSCSHFFLPFLIVPSLGQISI